MAAISATNSATPSTQQTLNSSRLQQARREADQAEAHAQDLRQQADGAELQAQKSQANVREQAARNQQTSSTYASPLKQSQPEVPAKTQDFLVSLYDATRDKRAASGNALKADANAASVLNAQGQATGRIVNLSA
jgi:phage I-like protein